MERPVWDDDPKESSFFNLSFLGSRWFMVTIASLAGLIGIAILYYLFTPGTSIVGEIPVIEAEETPSKIKPETPGGWVAPHQDKQIYENLLGSKESRDEVVRLAPGAEQPLSLPMDAAEISTREDPQQVTVEEVIEPVQVESVSHLAVPPKPLEKLPDVTPPKKTISGGDREKDREFAKGKGKTKVQLASLPSKSLAEKEMRLLKRKYGDLLKGKSLVVTEAHVPHKGTMYRVQATGVAHAAAFCKKIEAKGGKCFPAK